jgi:predicted molibdopterin-dependent oxidoreductase YjgC
MVRFGKENDNENPQVIRFLFDGLQMSAYPGDTIASALYAAGKRSWRKSGPGDERGLLCGMGICFDCVLSVDGVSNVRACQTLVTDDMVVVTNLSSQAV